MIRPACHIKPETALDHIAGYTCFVDGSVRDYQKFSVTSEKNFPSTGPLGPWMIRRNCRSEPPHADDASKRPGSPAFNHRFFDLFHPANHRILLGLYCAFRGRRHCDRHAEGVGHSRKPPLWMQPGDRLEVEIGGIGLLRADIVEERG